MEDDVQSLYDVSGADTQVIHNGIDIEQYRPRPDRSTLEDYGVDPDRPFVLFVGRITRQKGILHLVEAIRHFDPDIQVVLCAGAPDTEEIGAEMEARVEAVRAETENRIVWLAEMLPREDVITMYTHASVFVCPSVYEPFGIINLEAMACETPVVASRVGGIPEIVVPDETGLLVDVDPTGGDDVEPAAPDAFARGLADGVNALMRDPERREQMGTARGGAVQLDRHRGADARLLQVAGGRRALLTAARPWPVSCPSRGWRPAAFGPRPVVVPSVLYSAPCIGLSDFATLCARMS